MVGEGVIIFPTINEHVLLVRNQKSLMVTPRQRLDATSLLAEERDLSFISLCRIVARFDRRINLSYLSLVNNDVFCYYLNQVICWNKSTIGLLNKTTENVGYVVVGLVAISKFFTRCIQRADSMVATPEKLSLLI